MIQQWSLLNFGKLLGLTLLAFSLNFSEAAELTSHFSFKNLAEYALKNAPALQTARNNLRLSEIRKQNSWAALLPRVRMGTDLGLNSAYNFSAQGLNSTTKTPFTNMLNFSIFENLYDNGQNWNNYQISQHEFDLAKEQFEQIQNQFLLDLWTAYLNYCRQNLNILVIKDQLAFWQQQFQESQKQYLQGIKPRLLFLRLKADFNNSELSLVQAENFLRQQKNKLLSLLGKLEPEEYLRADAVSILRPGKMPDRWESEDFPRDIHKNMKISAMRIEIENLRRAQVQKTLWPQLNLSAAAGYNNYDFLGLGQNKLAGSNTNLNLFNSGSQNFNFSLAFGLTWDIWDFGVNRRNIESAELAYQNALLNLNTQNLDSELSWHNLILNLQNLARQYHLQQELFSLEKDSFKQLENDYRFGKVSYLDVQNAARTLFAAQSNVNQIYYDFQNKVYEYLAIKNEIYAAIFK